MTRAATGSRRILFVANGHGENAIAARLARAIRARAEGPLALDLFSLVGTGAVDDAVTLVGPRATMPSGGLVAMGNVRAFARDLRAGFLRLWVAQARFARAARDAYDTVVAVGDAYALAMAFLARRPTVFVGTAKSVYVARYGPFERTLLRRARRTFVRDDATARALREKRVDAEAPGNVIVDLIDDAVPAREGEWLGLLPGSRATAYADSVRLARVVASLATLRPARALLSLAPTLHAATFARALASDGWTVDAGAAEHEAFVATRGGARLVGWSGSLGALLRASVAVLGQAGTANEQAAAFGLPVVALAEPAERGDWYRMRQRRLLGDALAFVAPDPMQAARALDRLLDDPERLARMRRAGVARMGPPGGAVAIATAILRCAP